MAPRGVDIGDVLRLLVVEVAEQPVLQHLGETDHRIQRGAQLVRHVGEELRLVPARCLELPIQAAQLVVHPVEVRGEGTEFIAVGDIDVAREIARGDGLQPGVHFADRPDE